MRVQRLQHTRHAGRHAAAIEAVARRGAAHRWRQVRRARIQEQRVLPRAGERRQVAADGRQPCDEDGAVRPRGGSSSDLDGRAADVFARGDHAPERKYPRVHEERLG